MVPNLMRELAKRSYAAAFDGADGMRRALLGIENYLDDARENDPTITQDFVDSIYFAFIVSCANEKWYYNLVEFFIENGRLPNEGDSDLCYTSICCYGQPSAHYNNMDGGSDQFKDLLRYSSSIRNRKQIIPVEGAAGLPLHYIKILEYINADKYTQASIEELGVVGVKITKANLLDEFSQPTIRVLIEALSDTEEYLLVSLWNNPAEAYE